MSTRDEILRVATELFTLRGYRGVSYADIAEVLEITTTNIHYHFGNKLALAAEVLDTYAERIATRFRDIWTEPDRKLAQRVRETVEFNRATYRRFNKQGDEGHAWSLLARFAGDVDALDDRMRTRLIAYRREIHAHVCTAIDIAVADGELSPDMPRADVARVLAGAFNYASFVARDTGGFAGVERYYETVLDLVLRGYGAVPARAAAEPRKPARRRGTG